MLTMHRLSVSVLLFGSVGAVAKAASDGPHLVERADAANVVGSWGPLIKFPLVPVAVTLLPETGHVLAWSAGWVDHFENPVVNGSTVTTLWDPSTGNVSDAMVQNTRHDMFCPGTSMDEDGRIIVTGGSEAEKTSILDFRRGETSPWMAAANMNIPRGYQSSTLTSNNNVFVLGGDWSGPKNVSRDGEIYDTVANTWKVLPGCSASAMTIANGRFRDSHAWLFAWKNGSVFQAGPSKQMNWFNLEGNGSSTRAGLRGQDADSMCGNAVMYDAAAGKVFTYGGAPAYENVVSTSNAHVLTIGEPYHPVAVQQLPNGKYNRGFQNSVVLPDGRVWVVGGMQNMATFSDDTPQLTPELWDPVTGNFTSTAPHTIARNYHSVALLLADATVFSGGGGLCGPNCPANHFDGQVWYPPYLFEADGITPAPRPSIAALSSTTLKAGDLLRIAMHDVGNYTFSMVRIGPTTHGINTDARRIPLKPNDITQGTQFDVALPDDYGIVLPGFWMLFAMNDKGVPSVAQFFRVAL